MKTLIVVFTFLVLLIFNMFKQIIPNPTNHYSTFVKHNSLFEILQTETNRHRALVENVLQSYVALSL